MSDSQGNPVECTKETCDLKESIYGYYPNLGANVFFLVCFAILAIVQLAQGLRWKTWSYTVAMFFGAAGCAIGYGGRVMLNKDAFDPVGFNVQICCLIISPAFISAAVYLNLKHLVIVFGSEFSRLKPHLYTWIFILCDLLSLVLQGAGGGTASTADTDAQAKVGNNLMMAGIVFQVFTLLVFGAISGEFFWRAFKGKTHLNPAKAALRNTLNFKLYIGALTVAFVTLLARCVYRIAEMAGGWRNPIMQSEIDFIILEGVMVLIATFVLTALHPGYCMRLPGGAEETHMEEGKAVESPEG
ncbi:MAG: hypothetical protein M1832_001724 [Thelocarpon impressellum]|nr:MAG: hypothetical protein M1832_001724 [Thelocarpon impressellum]